MILLLGGLRASKIMHEDLLHSILRVPMYIFDITPIGRIVNRFSKDQYTMDESLPTVIYSYLSTLFRVIEVIVAISFVTPMFLVGLIPLGSIYYYTQKYYIATTRQLKRWTSVLQSPIYSHFSESLDGVSSIRAFGQSRRFMEENEGRLDANLRAFYLSIAANRWLAVRLEFVGNIIVTSAAIFAVVNRDTIDPGFGALSVSYALSVTQTLNWMVRMTSERETNIVSVERIKEYISLPCEAVERSEQPGHPPADWPSQGAIEFNNMWMRYRDGLPPVIKGITCEIKPSEKVGVVGRTGSGEHPSTYCTRLCFIVLFF